MILKDGKSAHISLDERTGSFFPLFVVLFFMDFIIIKENLFFGWVTGAGFVSQDLYLHGFFSASIKLPADYTAGVVVAFYVSYC